MTKAASKTENQNDSLAAYEETAEQIRRTIAKIETGLIAHDRKCSEEPQGHTWAAQGDLSYILHELTNISDFLNQTGEYAPDQIVKSYKSYDIYGNTIKVTIPEE
jgi:hypothetical protein